MLLPPLPAFAAEFEGGRRCAQAIPLSPETNFSALTSKTLKQLVKDHRVQCTGAMEKADFVSCLLRHVGLGSQEL